ncbi:RraA family protein [Arcobacter sp. F2176]|uniref:RraA family protein n=1 Tax=Arcobacter sp. F2176 TaxID=2044511 RepID=UPI00100A762A|nr:RraA family protein [Arcobacter sp. F2176]RXJ79153.1 S-adenosylmethionine--2-demethylmenaquinone methyltransferase [Arcobacter sp. F2176]
MDFFTADLCDAHPDKVYVLDNEFKNYGGKQKAYGEVVTIKLDRNNNDLKNLLKDLDGTGKIVVVDVEDEYFAVVGDNLAKFAVDNNYEGLIVNGYVRDTFFTKDMDLILFARGTCSRKYAPITEGKVGIDISFCGINFSQGDIVYADYDGIILTKEKIL